jgi:hypothetical protein
MMPGRQNSVPVLPAQDAGQLGVAGPGDSARRVTVTVRAGRLHWHFKLSKLCPDSNEQQCTEARVLLAQAFTGRKSESRSLAALSTGPGTGGHGK